MLTSWHPLLAGLAPELILLIGACVILLSGVMVGRSRDNMSSFAALVIIAASLCAAGLLHSEPCPTNTSLLADPLVFFARLITLSVGALIVLVNRHLPEPGERTEFNCLMLCSLAGIMLVSVANDLIFLFLALELVSVPTYILIGLSRRDIRAQEAVVKYFFLGAFAAAMMLYGFSFLYGASGTTQLFGSVTSPNSIASVIDLPSAAADRITRLGLLLAMAGLGFKIAAAPFHFYVADVYQGAASPVTGLLGFVPKFAGLIAMIRVLSLVGWNYDEGMFWLLWALAAVTMGVGNTLALMQNNVKRMLAYSSVAHSGYMLVGLVAGPGSDSTHAGAPFGTGVGGLLFYMTVYGVTNLGAFAALSFLRKENPPGDEIERADTMTSAETLEDLSGCAKRHPWAALALSLCVLSLMGLPPTGGFLGKLYIFSAALSSNAGTVRHPWMVALVVIGVINSAVAAAYYLRIIAACYLGKSGEEMTANPSRSLRLALAVCAIFAVGMFLRPRRLYEQSRAAVAALHDGSHIAVVHDIELHP